MQECFQMLLQEENQCTEHPAAALPWKAVRGDNSSLMAPCLPAQPCQHPAGALWSRRWPPPGCTDPCCSPALPQLPPPPWLHQNLPHVSAWTRRGGLKTRHSGGGCRRSPQCPHRGSSSGKIGGQNLREAGHHVETQLASPAWHCRSFWRMRGCVRGDLFFS